MMVLGDSAFGVGFGHEGRALMEEISALVKEAPERSLACSTTRGPNKKVPSINQKVGTQR